MQPNNRREELEEADVVTPADMAVDPADPVQGLDDAGGFYVEELGVDAQSQTEAEADLDAAADEDYREETEEENDVELELDTPQDTTADARAAAQGKKDVGDLYGVHVPTATEPPIDPHVESQTDTGENWLEAMEEDATENGPAPEHVVDVTDDSDVDHPNHHKTDTRDRPVADKGSGGPGGL